MAVKKNVKKTIVPPIVVEPKKEEKKTNFWQNAGWMLLLFGGLAHMLPEQMIAVMKWSLFGISLQLAIGTLSVVVALNFLLDD